MGAENEILSVAPLLESHYRQTLQSAGSYRITYSHADRQETEILSRDLTRLCQSRREKETLIPDWFTIGSVAGGR